MKNNNGSTDTELLEVDVPQVIKADLRKFNKAEQQVSLTVEALSNIKVEKAEDLPAAMDTLKKAKTVETLIENKRTELVKPFNAEVKKINTYAKELTSKLPPAIAKAKSIVIAFNQAEEKRVLAEKIAARKKQLVELGVIVETDETNFTCVHEKIQIQQDQIEGYEPMEWGILIGTIQFQLKEILNTAKEDAEIFGTDEDVKQVEEKIETVQKQAPVITMPTGTRVSGITKRWVFKVIDPKLVPREYLMLDEVKIRKSVAEGVRTIAGVNIYQEDGLAIRQ